MEEPARNALETVYVDEFTNGVLDPDQPMLGPVRNNGYIVANTAPGCWGPMITPGLHGGHEVTKPVYVEGARPGDAIAIKVVSIRVTSTVTASGTDKPVEGRYVGNAGIAAKCPQCGTLRPRTRTDGIGPGAIRCVNCGAETVPFRLENGYTMVFDDGPTVGVTVHKEAAERIAGRAREYMAIPSRSVQHPIALFAPADIVGAVARVRPFLGQLGTVPAVKFPDSYNAGDFGARLLNAPHEYALTEEQLALRTDGHMDINRVRTGAVLICPVRVEGGGVYVGDLHAMQGDGEVAGHTTDVSGLVTLQVTVLKNVRVDGPILLPRPEDLPAEAAPFTGEEKARALDLARRWGVESLEDSLPVSFIGTGRTINDAVQNGVERAATFLGIDNAEVLNRTTITGAVEIGRLPGVVTITFLHPVDELDRLGIGEIVRRQYRGGGDGA